MERTVIGIGILAAFVMIMSLPASIIWDEYMDYKLYKLCVEKYDGDEYYCADKHLKY